MASPASGGDARRFPEIDAHELLQVEIPVGRRGYDPDAVDELLERAAATIERLHALDEPAMENRRRTQADLLHRTLLLAQTSADAHLAEAESSAASVVADAQARARRLISEAEHAAEQVVDARAAQARTAIAGLLQRRALLEREIDGLEQFTVDARARLRTVFTTEATTLERVLSDATRGRPALTEVDLTDSLLDPAGAPAHGADAAARTDRDEDGPVTAVLVTDPEARSA